MKLNACLPAERVGSPSLTIGQLQQCDERAPVPRNRESKWPRPRRSPGGRRGQRRRSATRTPSLPPGDEQMSRCRPKSRKRLPDDTVGEVAYRESLPTRSPCRKRQGPSPTWLLPAGYKVLDFRRRVTCTSGEDGR